MRAGPWTWAVAVGVGALVISALFALPFFGDSNRGPTSGTDKAAERTADGDGRFVRPAARMSSGNSSAQGGDKTLNTNGDAALVGRSERKRGDRRTADGTDEEAQDALVGEVPDATLEEENTWRDAEVGGRDPDVPEEEENGERENLPISGWVFDQSGGPVGGIQVVSSPRRLFQDGVRDLSPTAWESRRTTTDKEGFFGFSQLADGEYQVSTHATDRFKAANTLVRAGIDSAVLVVDGDDQGPIDVYGRVASTQGEPLEGVRVAPIGQNAGTQTDEGGTYRLTIKGPRHPQKQGFWFSKDGYRKRHLTLAPTSGEESGDVRLDAQLEPLGETVEVTGGVSALGGAPVHMALVQLYSASLKQSYRAVSDRFGDFVMPAVEDASDYRLRVRAKADYKEYIEEGVTVPPGGLDLPLVLEPLNRATLTGRMVDVRGDPVPRFSLWLRSASPTTRRERLVTSDARGVFVADDLPEGEISFATRSSPQMSVTGVRLAAGAREDVTLVLDWGAFELYGTVQDVRGTPVPAAQVSLNWDDARSGLFSRSRRITATDGGGNFLFTQVGPGHHTLTVDAAGYQPARLGHSVGTSGGNVIIRLQKDKL